MEYELAFFDALIGPTIYSAPPEVLADITSANESALESISPLDDGFAWLRSPDTSECNEFDRWSEVG